MTSCTFAGAGFVISPTRGPGRNAHALWGAAFTAFAEKLSYNSCGSTSTLLFCVILKTDKLVGKRMTGRASALLKDLELKVKVM